MPTGVGARVRRILAAGAGLLAVLPVLAAAQIDPAALSGSWYNPDRSGEGFEFQVLDNGNFLIIWYTYPGSTDDPAAEQAFILGVGTLDGSVATVAEAIRTEGPVFGNAYDKNDLVEKPWGSFTVEFFDEDTARVDYSGTDGSGSTEVTRLSRLANPEEAGSLPAGISAAWYDPQTSGQGWFVEVLSATRALVYWFTYDANGNQAWNLNVGDIIGRAILIREALAGTGTGFGDAFNKDDVTLAPFGAYSLEFFDCDQGRVAWFSANGDLAGHLPIQRLSRLAGLPCDDGFTTSRGGTVTMMSNPSDPLLARIDTAWGARLDLLGSRDGASLPASASGGVIKQGESSWRLAFDAARGRTDMRDQGSGIQLLARATGDGTEATAIDTARDVSAARWTPAGEAAASQTSDAGSSPEGDAGASAQAQVNFCARPAGHAAVDFIVGAAGSETSDPAAPGFDPASVFIVPGASTSPGGFEATLPGPAAAIADATLASACPQLGAVASAACTMVSELGDDGLRPMCTDLGVAGEGNAEARLAAFNGCEEAYLQQAAFCRAFAELIDDPDSLCDSPDILYREPGVQSPDVWAQARAPLVGSAVLTGSLLDDGTGALLDFGTILASDGGPADLRADPPAPAAGESYQLTVEVPCAAPGQTLQALRGDEAAEFCSVDGNRMCTFTLATEPEWTSDSVRITGPGELAFDHRRALLGTDMSSLAKPALLSPPAGTVLPNDCDGGGVAWEFEWSTVDGATAYGIEVGNSAGYSGRFAFRAEGLQPDSPGSSSVFWEVVVGGPIESQDLGDWTWRVWAEDDQGGRSVQPDAEREFSVEACPADPDPDPEPDYDGLYGGGLEASGEVFVPQAGDSTCTASITMDLDAEASITAAGGSWIAFEGIGETTASNPSPDVPPEDCEDNSGVYEVPRFEIPLTVDGDEVEGGGTDGNFDVTVTGFLDGNGLTVTFRLRPTFPLVSGSIRSAPTLLQKLGD